MTTVKQDRDFAESITNPDAMLEAAIEWIGNNLSPEEVFGERQLEAWAKENGFVEKED